jgi:hypothetical protein
VFLPTLDPKHNKKKERKKDEEEKQSKLTASYATQKSGLVCRPDNLPSGLIPFWVVSRFLVFGLLSAFLDFGSSRSRILKSPMLPPVVVVSQPVRQLVSFDSVHC